MNDTTYFEMGKPKTGLTDRISGDYHELQAVMHVEDKSYGTMGHRYAETVIKLIDEIGAKSVLDYGCGKGTLKKALADMGVRDVREYDPAVPGKDSDPEMAELVVCTDVLEHVEEDKLDNVLEHIRQLSIKAALLLVACRPALKSLPDGRNAHLIVRDADWWQKRLAPFFEVVERSDSKSDVAAVIFIVKPHRIMGDIKPVAVLSEETRFEHARQNVKVTDRRIKLTPPHNRVAILCCYGPSLEDTWPSVIEEFTVLKDHEGADIVTVSGAHDFLASKGIVPHYHIECDPREHKGMMTKELHPSTTYLYASVCHPKVVGRFKDKDNLVIWHLDGGEVGYRIRRELDPNCHLIGGGSSVGLRAFGVLATMGYRRFIVHGMDCSYREEATHAGDHGGKKQRRIEVTSYGRKFETTPVLLAQLKEFDDLRQHFVGKAPEKLEIIMRGDGLLQHSLISTPGATESFMIDEVNHG